MRIVAVVVLAGCTASGGGDASTDGESSTGAEPTTIVPSTGEGSTSSSSDGSTDATSSSSEGSGSSESGEPAIDDCERLDALIEQLEAAPPDAAELVDAFVTETLYSEHGFPLRCDGRYGFVVRSPASEDVAVVGDFNDWDARAHPLSAVGSELFVAFVDEPVAPSLYKLVFDGTEFVADPLARRFGWDEFGEYSLTAARPDASHHERWPAFGDAAGELEPRTLVVYVPAGALDRSALPVLYMHDGQNLFAPDAFFGGWQASIAADTLLDAGSIDPFLIVAIPNTAARFDEYTHVQDDIGGGPVGGRADEYAAFIVDGIKPFVDDRYPTDPDPPATGVAGSSLGGLVSIYLAWRHPDVFGHAASMSGTFEWGTMGLDNETIAELVASRPPEGVSIYLDSGGGGPCPGGSDNYCSTVDLADTLRDLGWVDKADLFYRFDADAPHNEAAWASRFPAMLSEWFPG